MRDHGKCEGIARHYNLRVRRLTLIFVMIFSTHAFAWGPEGHRIVADVARDHLTPAALQALRQILGTDDLASASTWADDIRRDRPETAGWHFVDIPWGADGFSEPRDCYRPNPRFFGSERDHHNCVVDRIEMFERILADPHRPREDRAEAAKFLIHFVADLHQPFHAIAEARGGNEVHVVQFGSAECGHKLCDLHGTWDFGLIAHARRPEDEYAAYIERLIASRRFQVRTGGGPEEWANESFRIAHRVWVRDGSAVDEAYYRQNVEVLDEQLAIAGLRLAAALNRALGEGQ